MDSKKEDKFEINSDEKDSVFILRQFTKFTKRDIEIHSLPIPNKPLWLKYTVKSIRVYQNKLAPSLGNRCVFDPSCSRYSELAFREKGFLQGILLTLKRLRKCNPKNGGVDELK